MSYRFLWIGAAILMTLAIGCASRIPSNTLPPSLPFSLQDLQPPETGEEERPIAFEALPKTKMGYVDWVAAIQQGIIKPRAFLDPNRRPMPPVNFNILYKVKFQGIPDAVFPHQPHTLWLDCRNCHPGIFLMRAGVNRVTMERILKGEACGRCHGKVAFPISDCFRCHFSPQ